MELISNGEGSFHSPPVPNTPIAQVLFGGVEGGPDVGVAKVRVPVGTAMPEHDHSGSDVIVMPIEGSLEITKGGEPTAIGVGDALLIHKHEKVGVRNPNDTDAEFIVAAAPPNFLVGIRGWPAPE